MIDTNPVIEASSLTKTFGATVAVDSVSMRIGAGEIVALLGKNGAGKTTLIDMILGLQRPTSGTSALFGMQPRRAIAASLIGAVHQSGALPVDYTVRETLSLFAATHARPLGVDAIMEETRLAHFARRPIRKLSGGECQRVRLALALLPDPSLLILDEPTAGMDATARRDFWDLMKGQANRGRTIVFATHYLAEAEEFAQRTIIMKDGGIAADSPTYDLRSSYSRRRLRITVPERASSDACRQLAGIGLDAQCTSTDGGEAMIAVTGDSLDEAARRLLSIDGAHGLEISASSLEDVFAALTA